MSVRDAYRVQRDLLARLLADGDRVVGYKLGLQNMADRIGAVGGDVRVSSAAGTGTQVAGWVPVALATSEASPGAASPPPWSTASTPPAT